MGLPGLPVAPHKKNAQDLLVLRASYPAGRQTRKALAALLINQTEWLTPMKMIQLSGYKTSGAGTC